MLLASVDSIREALGLDPMTDVVNAIGSALHGAEASLAAAIGSAFDEAVFADVFYVYDASAEGSSFRTEMKLSRGFVRPETLAVVFSRTLAGLTDGTDGTGEVALDADKGVVIDCVRGYRDTFIGVEGFAGFPASGDDPESYDLGEVPNWLQEAAKLQARIALDTHPVFSDLGVKQDVQALRHQLDLIVAGKVRYAPAALLPLNR